MSTIGDIITSIEDAIGWIEENVFPLVPALLAAFWPGAPPVATVIVNAIPGLMKQAQAIEGATGPAKKEAVLAFAKAIADGADAATTGGAKETWDKLLPVIDTLINATKAQANAKVAPPASVVAAPSAPLSSAELGA